MHEASIVVIIIFADWNLENTPVTTVKEQLKTGKIPSCERVIIQGENPVPVFLHTY